MSKRWTQKDDDFLIEFYDAIGSSIGPMDLGRTEQSVKNRVKQLKKSGAWEAYKTARHHRNRALVLARHVLPEFCDD